MKKIMKWFYEMKIAPSISDHSKMGNSKQNEYL